MKLSSIGELKFYITARVLWVCVCIYVCVCVCVCVKSSHSSHRAMFLLYHLFHSTKLFDLPDDAIETAATCFGEGLRAGDGVVFKTETEKVRKLLLMVPLRTERYHQHLTRVSEIICIETERNIMDPKINIFFNILNCFSTPYSNLYAIKLTDFHLIPWKYVRSLFLFLARNATMPGFLLLLKPNSFKIIIIYKLVKLYFKVGCIAFQTLIFDN